MAYASQNWTKELLGKTLKDAKDKGLLGGGSSDGGASVAVDIYSEEETVIGEWIDGKPLYRKTFLFDNLPIDNSIHEIALINEVNLINSYGTFTWDKTSDPQTFSIPFFYSSGVYIIVDIKANLKNNLNSIVLRTYYSKTSTVINDIRLILEYTKNTDSENSFAPSMVNSYYCAESPVGTIISFMGKTAPTNYLTCDGTEYNISSYSELAEFIKTQFGSYNYFGGNGTTTFAVPDLQGEFLRGSGTNSHENQGSGGEVGEHQDATEHFRLQNYIDNHIYIYKQKDSNISLQKNYDSIFNSNDNGAGYHYAPVSDSGYTSDVEQFITSRPTNTSVLFCIKYKSLYLNAPSDDTATEDDIEEVFA